MKTALFVTVAMLLTSTCSTAEAASAPAPLRGKSVIVGWTESRVQRWVGEEHFRSVTIQHQFRIYVSTAGRVFSRLTNTNPSGNSGSRDEVMGGGRTTSVPEFRGQTMIMMALGGGSSAARRITVNFDAGFGSCSGEVVRAKQAGADTTVGTSMITGRKNEIKSATVSGASCSMQNGNVFGGE